MTRARDVESRGLNIMVAKVLSVFYPPVVGLLDIVHLKLRMLLLFFLNELFACEDIKNEIGVRE